MEPLELEVARDGTSASVLVRGEVDLSTSPRLRTACMDLAQDGARMVHIDLGEVEFLDSSGISVLVQAKRRFQSDGGDVVLHRVGGQTRRVFDIAGLDGYFEFSDEPAG